MIDFLYRTCFLSDTRKTVRKVNKLLIRSNIEDKLCKLSRARKIIVKWYERNYLDIIMIDDNFNNWLYNAIKDMYDYDLQCETNKLNNKIEHFLYKVTVIEKYFDKENK